jgi:hypothetical protein
MAAEAPARPVLPDLDAAPPRLAQGSGFKGVLTPKPFSNLFKPVRKRSLETLEFERLRFMRLKMLNFRKVVKGSKFF